MNASFLAVSVDELLAGATGREPMSAVDGKSEVLFERVVIGDARYVLKHLHCDGDWIARVSGDVTCRPLQVFRSGLLDDLPGCIDHTVVGAAAGLGRHGWGAALLMRDVGEWLVPGGDDPLPLEQHLRFLDHMAALHAAFWGWEDTVGLTPYSHRYLCFGPWLTKTEVALGSTVTVPRLVEKGWAAFRQAAPRAAEAVLELVSGPWPLIEALEATPSTLLHGDWKAGNLGTGPDGRTILLDWAMPGRGPAASDLAWYLAINAARLPHSSEDAIAVYRRSLERQGIDTNGWCERQLGLALLGAVIQLGWDKALFATADDLAWWEERALEGTRYL